MTRWMYVALLALALIAGGGWILTQSGAPGSSEIAAPADLSLPGAANAQAAEVDTSGIVEMTLGNPDAEVEVIEYASYTCPHCASFHTGGVYDQIKTNYIDPGKIKFTYREVYFDKYGVWASIVARCAGPEKFFPITDLIYKGQSQWARAGSDAAIADELRKIGLLAGIEKDALEACLTDGDRVKALVAWYQENAEEHGVRSTPSFVIDGTLYNNMSYDEFQEILDDALGE